MKNITLADLANKKQAKLDVFNCIHGNRMRPTGKCQWGDISFGGNMYCYLTKYLQEKVHLG